LTDLESTPFVPWLPSGASLLRELCRRHDPMLSYKCSHSHHPWPSVPQGTTAGVWCTAELAPSFTGRVPGASSMPRLLQPWWLPMHGCNAMLQPTGASSLEACLLQLPGSQLQSWCGSAAAAALQPWSRLPATISCRCSCWNAMLDVLVFGVVPFTCLLQRCSEAALALLPRCSRVACRRPRVAAACSCWDGWEHCICVLVQLLTVSGLAAPS
jgi:hypothetical protein